MLRSHGYDAISAHEGGALQIEDPEQLERASREGRTLLTYNYHDFLRISDEWFWDGRSHAGIVISYRQYSRDELGTLFRTVVALLESLTVEELRDSVVVLDRFLGEVDQHDNRPGRRAGLSFVVTYEIRSARTAWEARMASSPDWPGWSGCWMLSQPS